MQKEKLSFGINGGTFKFELEFALLVERESLRRQKQAAVKIPWSNILKFEISPPRVSGKGSTPAYWIIHLSDAKTVFYVRRFFFKGREKEIVAAIQARLPISMEIRDELN